MAILKYLQKMLSLVVLITLFFLAGIGLICYLMQWLGIQQIGKFALWTIIIGIPLFAIIGIAFTRTVVRSALRLENGLNVPAAQRWMATSMQGLVITVMLLIWWQDGLITGLQVLFLIPFAALLFYETGGWLSLVSAKLYRKQFSSAFREQQQVNQTRFVLENHSIITSIVGENKWRAVLDKQIKNYPWIKELHLCTAQGHLGVGQDGKLVTADPPGGEQPGELALPPDQIQIGVPLKGHVGHLIAVQVLNPRTAHFIYHDQTDQLFNAICFPLSTKISDAINLGLLLVGIIMAMIIGYTDASAVALKKSFISGMHFSLLVV
ncbi:MAG: hypothetical protein ACM3PA_00800 [Methanomassiliicoccales archaeon]